MEQTAIIKVSEETRHELRKYKAEHGETYNEAIRRLMKEEGWVDNE